MEKDAGPDDAGEREGDAACGERVVWILLRRRSFIGPVMIADRMVHSINTLIVAWRALNAVSLYPRVVGVTPGADLRFCALTHTATATIIPPFPIGRNLV